MLDYESLIYGDDTAEDLDFSVLLGDGCTVAPHASNHDVAVDLAQRGFAVFPIIEHDDPDEPGKKKWSPKKGWQKLASTDVGRIDRWWRTHPHARVGLPCGEVNGITVLDLDVKNGKDGIASLTELGFPNLAAMSPVRARTPSGGGRHLFFCYEPRLKNWVDKIATGIDVRTEGSYVLAPGSWKDGARYIPEGFAIGTVELPIVPESLIPPPEPERQPIDVLIEPSAWQVAWANTRLQEWADDLAALPEGNRNVELNSAAMWAGGAAAHGLVTEDAARQILSAAAEKAGLKPRDVRTTFNSGWKAGLRKPISDFPRDVGDTDPDEFDNVDDLPAPGAQDGEVAEKAGKPTSAHGPLEDLNKRCALVMMGSKALIAATSEITDRLDFWQVQSFHQFFANQRIKIVDPRTKKPKRVALSEAWMQWPQRRTYAGGITFSPEGGPDDQINLWRGWAVEPDGAADCSLFLGHIREVVCSGNAEHFGYVIGWLAHLVQCPADKPGVALVLRGLKGTGKDVMGRYLARMIGRRHVPNVAQESHVTGRFNEHFQSALLVHVEEAVWAGSKQGESVLKNLLTAPFLTIERKGVDVYQARSCFRMLMSSNADWTVPASGDERRFAVFDVSARRRGDAEYFARLHDEMEADGPAALLHFLQNYDLADFNVRKAPETDALRDQKVASLRGVEAWWLELLYHGRLSFGFGDAGDWDAEAQVVGREALRRAYVDWTAKQRYGGTPVNDVLFGRRLREMLPGIRDRRGRDGQSRIWQYIIPELRDCRASFAEWLRSPVDWER